MKIAKRAGHNSQASGAVGILSEVTEDRKISAAVEKWLKLDNQTVIDVTPGNCVSSADLTYGVNKANAAKVDIFASIHLNAGGGHGVEVLYSPHSTIGQQLATRVCNCMAKLGFTNRGAKSDVRGLYELKHTVMAAIIVETFFCDSAADVILYQKLGADKLGKAIAEGIVGHEIVVKESFTTDKSVLLVQQVANRLGVRDLAGNKIVEDGIIGKKTLEAKAKIKIYIDMVLK